MSLWCRLFHRWKPGPVWHPNQIEAWQRMTCKRCEAHDPPTPARP